MKKIAIRGGFHNCQETFVKVSDRAYNAFEDVELGFTSISEWADYFLSDSQRSRLEKHFCGLADCCCGSYCRAEWKRL